MRMSEIIKLVTSTTAPNEVGIPVETTTSVDVYADRKSVKRTEYYAANAAGSRADVTFVVNADDYSGQMRVEHGSEKYEVTRAYQAGLGRVELTCAKR